MKRYECNVREHRKDWQVAIVYPDSKMSFSLNPQIISTDYYVDCKIYPKRNLQRIDF